MAPDSASDPTPSPDPAPTPDPTPPPAPTPTPPAPRPHAPPPGWKTSEAWLTFLTMVIGAVPTSSLTANAPLLSKIVGMVIAALAAINYVAHRTALKRAYLAVAAGTPAPQISRAPQLAASALLVAVVAAVAVVPTSCGSLNCSDPKNASNVACTIENGVVDCIGVSSLPPAVAVVTPVVEKLVASARQPDGTITWSSIEQQLVDLALQYGMCVVAEVWNQLTSSPPAGSGSALVVARTPASASFAEEFNRLRARVAPGRQFKTSRGTL